MADVPSVPPDKNVCKTHRILCIRNYDAASRCQILVTSVEVLQKKVKLLCDSVVGSNDLFVGNAKEEPEEFLCNILSDLETMKNDLNMNFFTSSSSSVLLSLDPQNNSLLYFFSNLQHLCSCVKEKWIRFVNVLKGHQNVYLNSTNIQNCFHMWHESVASVFSILPDAFHYSYLNPMASYKSCDTEGKKRMQMYKCLDLMNDIQQSMDELCLLIL